MLKVKRKYVSLDNFARKNVFKMGLSCRFSSNYWSQPTIGQIQLLVTANYWSDPTIGQLQLLVSSNYWSDPTIGQIQ